MTASMTEKVIDTTSFFFIFGIFKKKYNDFTLVQVQLSTVNDKWTALIVVR